MLWMIPAAIALYTFWPKNPGTMMPVIGPMITFGPMTKNAIDNAAFAKAKAKLIHSEGNKDIAYLDSRGILTVGIGHRVLSTDNIKLGQKISAARVNQLFEKDIAVAFAAARAQAQELGKYTPDFIAALTEVNFQLGTGWKYKFANTWADLKKDNVQSAIRRLKQSDWAEQTPVRVSAFIAALEEAFT